MIFDHRRLYLRGVPELKQEATEVPMAANGDALAPWTLKVAMRLLN